MENRFDQQASQWDQQDTRVKMASEIAQAMAQVLELSPERDLLDFGAGTGLVTLQLQPRVRKVYAFDTSKGMLRALQEKLAQNHIGNVEVLAGDPDATPVLPAVDIIVSSMTLHHVRDIPALARAFRAALRPGGQLAIADLDLDGGLFHAEHADVLHNGFDRGALGEELADAGFASVEFRDATSVTKPGADGVVRPFSIFLVTARA
jgi:ubiquinone/menaquinone biosynthesis C-methylase UbiE